MLNIINSLINDNSMMHRYQCWWFNCNQSVHCQCNNYNINITNTIRVVRMLLNAIFRCAFHNIVIINPCATTKSIPNKKVSCNVSEPSILVSWMCFLELSFVFIQSLPYIRFDIKWYKMLKQLQVVFIFAFTWPRRKSVRCVPKLTVECPLSVRFCTNLM